MYKYTPYECQTPQVHAQSYSSSILILLPLCFSQMYKLSIAYRFAIVALTAVGGMGIYRADKIHT
jgi:hypothetical protein